MIERHLDNIVSPLLIHQPVMTAYLPARLMERTRKSIRGWVVLAGIYLAHSSWEGSNTAELAISRN